MKRDILLFVFIFAAFISRGQEQTYDIYYPQKIEAKDWKVRAQIYYDNHNNSNGFINEFTSAINQSKYLNQELKDRQSQSLGSSTLSGRSLKSGFDLYLNAKDPNKDLYYYFGLDHQQILDSRIDKNMVNLLLYGNQAYAGEQLSIENTEYSSVYFNRIKIGIGKRLGKGELKHELSAKLGLNFGQNYDAVQVHHSKFYTHPQGDYLDIDFQAETQLADSVWGSLFTINGMGASIDLHYSVHQDKKFFLGVHIANIGFIHWNKSPYIAAADSSFTFSGLENDSLNQEQIPNDFSYNNLRNLLFTQPSHEAFTELLPFDIQLTGGVYFANGKFYMGMNTHFYPTLMATYRAEIFVSYKYMDFFSLTPIIGYNSYEQFHMGLAVGFELWDLINIRAGSSYLNTMFNPNAKLGQGGYVSVALVI